MSMISKAKKNILFGFVNKIAMMLFPFSIRSIIIWRLGVEYVGLSSLFSAILQVLSLAELGFGSAVVYSMYKPIAEDDKDAICALLSVFRKTYLIVGLVIFSIGLLITPFLSFLISGDYPRDVNIYILYCIYLLNTVLSYFFYGYKQSLLIAHQRNDVESLVTVIANVIMYCAQICILLFLENYYYYTVLILLGTIILNLLRNYKVTKMYPWAVPQGSINATMRSDMKKRVCGLLLSNICTVCRNSFDSIIISAFLGLVILGRFQNYYYVMNVITGFLHIITTSLLGGIGLNLVQKSKEENYRYFRILGFVYNWVSTICTICLLCLYQPFMLLWVGEENMFSQKLVVCMCIYFYVLKIGDVTSLYKEAAGLYWEDRYRPIIESVANLLFNILFVMIWGVYGVVLSTIISIVFINIPWATNTLFRAYFKMSMKQILEDVLQYIVVLCFLAALTYWCCSFIRIEGLKGMLLRLVLCLLIPNMLYFSLYYRSDKMKNAISLIRYNKE